MKNSDLAILFPALNKSNTFQRDTPLLLETLERLEQSNQTVNFIRGESKKRIEKL